MSARYRGVQFDGSPLVDYFGPLTSLARAKSFAPAFVGTVGRGPSLPVDFWGRSLAAKPFAAASAAFALASTAARSTVPEVEMHFKVDPLFSRVQA